MSDFVAGPSRDKPTGEHPYPEHLKLRAVKDQSQTIGQFIDWLMHEREPAVELMVLQQGRNFCDYRPVGGTIQTLLAEYLEIDLQKLDAEKEAMLDACRKDHASPPSPE